MSLISEDEIVAFDVYFASICSMQVHPGAGSKEHVPLDIGQCKEMAMKMIEVRRNVIGGDLCHGE